MIVYYLQRSRNDDGRRACVLIDHCTLTELHSCTAMHALWQCAGRAVRKLYLAANFTSNYVDI